MSFIVDNCYGFSKKLEGLVDPTDTTIKDEEATLGTETSDNDEIADNKAATQIQAIIRGMIVRNRALNEAEQSSVMETRTRAGETIMSESGEESNESIESNIRTVRELLKSNKTTWEHCQKSLIEEKNGSIHTFMRVGFMTVHTRTENGNIEFTSRAESSEKSYDFKSLEILPGKLGGIFEVTHDEFGFVEYEAFLEKSLLLHERVLHPFLMKLKGHLTSINELLFEIATWLTEPINDLAFLKKIFELHDTFEITTETTTLKKRHLQDDFQVTGSFNIQNSRDQKMLGKLLCFLSE